MRGPVARPATKWWGWGLESVESRIESRPELWRLIRTALDITSDDRWPVPRPEDIRIRSSLISDTDRQALAGIVGGDGVFSDDLARLAHALGKSYVDLVRIRRNEVGHGPDAVVVPRSEGEVRGVIDLASDRGWAIIPYGGGTSVVGGVEPKEPRVHITLALQRMNRVREVDEQSLLATAEAGITGPDLEHGLHANQLTAGHWPQSFEFSTLGGWIAARGVGAWSNRYGKAEDIVAGATLVAPRGTLRIRPFPRGSTGPDLLSLITGSEGALGVITEATIKVRREPEVQVFDTYLFRSFGEGLEAFRAMSQSGDAPPLAYVYDGQETRFRAASWSGVSRRARRLPEGASAFVAGFQGSVSEVARLRAACRAACRGAVPLNTSDGKEWFRARHETPYTRDSLVEHRILIDSFETATTWAKLERLWAATTAAVRNALASTGTPSIVLCHAAHAYPHGCSLYVTFLARMEVTREVEQWRTVKAAAVRALLDHGGVVSHHHGIGADHLAYLREALGDTAVAALRALKTSLDPANMMNPGKLVPG